MNAKRTWHDRRGYPPAPFPYRDTPRPMPSSTLSSNNTTPYHETSSIPYHEPSRRNNHYHKPTSPKQKSVHKKNKKTKHRYKNSGAIKATQKTGKKKKKSFWQKRRHLAIDMPMFNRRRAIKITNALLLTLFWVILAGLIIFGVYMYLYVFNVDDAKPTDGPTTERLVSRTFDGSFELLTINGSTASFQPELNDPNSGEFHDLADAVEASFDVIYESTDNATYVGSSVTAFHDGSIITDFTVTFHVAENSSLDLGTQVKSALINAIEGGSDTDSELLRGADGDTVVIVEVVASTVSTDVTTTEPTTEPTTTTTTENVIVIDPICGSAHIELNPTNPNHQLRSYGYPGLNNHINCTWLVTSPQYTTVHIVFRDFGTTTDSEYIRIGDSWNSTNIESVMFEYSGHQIPAGISKSSENALWIEFVGNIGSRGFSMDIDYNIDCGGNVIMGTIYEPVIIHSLGYPDGLAVPFHCLWLFVSQYETKMTVTIHDFDVIFPTDWFRIGNGLNESNSDSIIFEHSGQGVDVTTVVSPSNAMWISYASPDGTTQRGFNITVSFGPLYECGATSITEYSNFHWPWLVWLVADEDVIEDYSCTAVIVDKRWLLTTSTCLVNISSEKFLTASTNDGSANGILVEVDDFLLHPGFNSSFINDLAIIHLARNLSFSEHIRHVCYSSENVLFERCLIVGLDITNPIDIDHEMLGTSEECMNVRNIELCVEIPDDIEINCEELQGTQLICSDSDGYWNLVGIAGYGSSRCSSLNDRIVTFTNISAYLEWIHDVKVNWDHYDTIKADCGQSIYELDTTDEHTLFSPNYPSNYPLYVACDWTILAPENYRVLLHITYFNTQFCCDLVTLSDMDSSLVLSGDVTSEYLVSSGNEATVVFHTDKHITGPGFIIHIETIHENEAAQYTEL